MLKRSFSPGRLKTLRRNGPIVLAAGDDGDPDVSMASLHESFLLGSPSRSRESSESLEESEDYECQLLAKDGGGTDSEYQEDNDDDDDEEEDDQEDLALKTSYERVTVKIPTLPSDEEDEIVVYGVHDLNKGFGDWLRHYLFTVNAFVPSCKHGSAFHHLFSRLFHVPQEQEFRVTDHVHEKVMKTFSNCRARLSLVVKEAMISYTFDDTTLPDKCKKNRKRQLKYMLDAMRFARKDYLSTGALLQSTMLGDVIAKVFYQGKGMGLVLEEDSEDKVPRPVIALAFVFMYVNMHMLCHKKRDQKFVRGREAGSFRASLYHTTLRGVYDNGEAVDWNEVQRIQTERVHQNLKRCEVSGSLAFCPLSASYRPKYQDGVYVTDSEED